MGKLYLSPEFCDKTSAVSGPDNQVTIFAARICVRIRPTALRAAVPCEHRIRDTS